MGREKQTFKFISSQYKSMKTVKVKGKEYKLEDKDAALIETIKELIETINSLRSR